MTKQSDIVERVKEFDEFIKGSGPLDGKWFSDTITLQNGLKAKYWWRRKSPLSEAAQTITDQAALIDELVGALKPFATIPLHGKHGGPFVIGSAAYEDMCDGDTAPRAAYFHKDQIERGVKALAKVEQWKAG